MGRALRSTRFGGSVVLTAALAGCAAPAQPAGEGGAGSALLGAEPVARIHLFENNSSSLLAWRRAGVRERVLVHLDGHSDLDWVPDETVARLAAATPDELSDLEQHPYAMGGEVLHGFGIWNFVYPAWRMGIVREMYWVVPDGTLSDRGAAQRLVRELVVNKIQGFRIEELRALRYDGRTVRGEILGLPVTICELRDLPEIEEPVLLDIDLDYFTTRSAMTQYVTAEPWIRPVKVVETLQAKRLRTDLVTMCFSTIGGYLPPSARWVGPRLQELLRAPQDTALRAPDPRGAPPRDRVGEVSDLEREVRRRRDLVALRPDDASAWFGLAEQLESAGRREEADAARARAAGLDPLLEHGHLFVADRLWINEGFEAALARYDRYLERFPDGPFAAYALRRRAGCLMRLRRDDEAIEAFRRVIALAPRHADSRLDLGVLYRERGDLERALEQLEAARRILPDRGIYARALGTTYLLAGRVEEATEHLAFAVESQPCQAATRGNLSAALLQAGRYEEAARHLAIAMFLQPNNPQFRFTATQLDRRGIQVRPVSAP